MSIVEETRRALLALFPEQQAADAEAALEVVEADEALETSAEVSEESGAEAVEAAAKETVAEEPAEERPRENGVLGTDYAARGTHLDVLCAPEQVVQAAEILDQAGFFIEAVSGVDWLKDDRMEVIYDYSHAVTAPCRVVVRTFIPRSEPMISTISHVYPGANWHERETHDFFGITFEGHPYLEPLLLPEDADFHPLLKDFKP